MVSDELVEFAFRALSRGASIDEVVAEVNREWVPEGYKAWDAESLTNSLESGLHLGLDTEYGTFLAALAWQALRLRDLLPSDTHMRRRHVAELVDGDTWEDMDAFAAEHCCSPSGVVEMVVRDFLDGTRNAHSEFQLRPGQAAYFRRDVNAKEKF